MGNTDNAYIEMSLKNIQEDILEVKRRGGSVKTISDGYHTFDELYMHRMVLSSLVFNQHKELAWKSKQHHDGTMFDGMFIVGIDTPKGQYSYHYKLEHWDLFDVVPVHSAPEYDGHMPSDIGRLFSL